MPSPETEVDKLLDEILMLTIINKNWDYKRVAEYVIDKQIDILLPIESLTGSSAVTDKILELKAILKLIRKSRK
jgi:hypothetical protein